MRAMTAVVCAFLTGCVVYRDNGESWTDSSWTSTDGTSTPSPEAGQIDVSWQIGASGCEEGGVATVEVDIGSDVGTFDCSDEQASLAAPAGRYEVRLRGLDAEGVARYAGEVGKVRVHQGETTVAPTVVLSALPASVEATWYFDNGRLCAENDVTEIEAILFDEDDTIQLSVTTACDAATIRFDDVEAGPYTLLLLGRDDERAVLWRGEADIDAGRGDAVDLDVALVPEE